MDIDKVRKWLELTNQYQKNDFWRNLFSHSVPEKMLRADEAFPLYDIYQNQSSVCIVIEISGINKNDLSISLRQKSTLVVKGKTVPLFPDEMTIKKERFYGEFERLIPLPEPTDPQLMQVHFFDGLVQVTYPRKNENRSAADYDESLFN